MVEQEKITLNALLAASSSTARRVGVQLMGEASLGSSLVTHGVAPDKKCGVFESEIDPPNVVALDKALVVAVALGLLSPEQVAVIVAHAFDNLPDDEENQRKWLEKVIKLDPSEYQLEDGDLVGIWASDVVTKVRRKSDSKARELLKIDRKTQGKSKRKRKEIYKKDRRKMYELYNNGEFLALFRVAMAYWDNSGRVRVEQWDIQAEFDQVKKREIKAAYRKGGSAHYSGPRLDLAQMALEGKAKSLMIKKTSENDEAFRPVSSELVHMLVREGILYPHAFLQFIAGEEIELEKSGIIG